MLFSKKTPDLERGDQNTQSSQHEFTDREGKKNKKNKNDSGPGPAIPDPPISPLKPTARLKAKSKAEAEEKKMKKKSESKDGKPKEMSKSFHKITSTYASRFGENDDQETVTEEERQVRQKSASAGTDQYYDFATSAYLSGWGEHFHYTPFAPGDSIATAMTYYEHRFANILGLTHDMRVLDVGCGVGGPAREIARFIGCQVVGLTINQRQVDKAIELTIEAGLDSRCTFIQGDFMNMPFPDASFDAVIAIEATVHAPCLATIYSNIRRVLKPNGVFGLSEWCLSENYNPDNTSHVGIRNRIERGNAISNLQTSEQVETAVRAAGFDIFYAEHFDKHWNKSYEDRPLTYRNDYHKPREFVLAGPGRVQQANDNHAPRSYSSVEIPMIPQPGYEGDLDGPTPVESEIGSFESWSFRYHYSLAPKPAHDIDVALPGFRPWWWALDGQWRLANTWADKWIAWRMSPFARKLCWIVIWILEHLRLYPKGTLSAMATMAYCVDSVVEGGKEDIFSPCFWVMASVMEIPLPGSIRAQTKMYRHGNEQGKHYGRKRSWRTSSM